jgi:hypothetical protein
MIRQNSNPLASQSLGQSLSVCFGLLQHCAWLGTDRPNASSVTSPSAARTLSQQAASATTEPDCPNTGRSAAATPTVGAYLWAQLGR